MTDFRYYDLPLETWIIIHVSYREVFNAPVKILDLKKWIRSDSLESEIDDVLDTLVAKGHIVSLNGYIARAGREDCIRQQPAKTEKAQEILDKGLPLIEKLRRLGFIEFIGVSGSIAADNPVCLIEGLDEGQTDLDLYVITSAHAIWIFVFFEHIISYFRKRLKRRHFYCFNYITEKNFLEITNKNFFTATEFMNLKPLINGENKDKLLASNTWIKKFYAVEAPEELRQTSQKSSSFFSKALNYTFFTTYFLLSSLKRLDFDMIRRLRKKHDPHFRHNYKRVCSPIGGYELVIARKFTDLFRSHFPSFYQEQVVHFLFPNELEISDRGQGNLLKAKREFTKYENAESTL